ncbi:arf-GAP with Rho-GAP domain, ANK repeat and PH domain-containing protein 2 isoform X2 [Carcharodon carcharias]|uniref:arf-GAP with Rho-GAP domain, ANK repeat and PH domain-containing protein 2 isoform X2 n=1 Tax=Carcharodon carcharias TaxID=13397 RepID=UPI001B7E1584|nr:arf-GAP with Rho-GAP domain, ANK repeat and PH domain-containing protein 2 isoform X2 [Carcharodon carcharias]
MLSCSEAGGDIADWLISIHLEQYADHFKQSGYFTVGDCKNLNNEILLQVGIAPTGHRKRILKHLSSVFAEADASIVSKSPDKSLTRDSDLESDNRGFTLHSPIKISDREVEEAERSVSVSKLRTMFVAGGVTSDRTDPVNIDGGINSKNKIPFPQMQGIEVQQKFPVSKNLKIDASEPGDACFNLCEPHDNVDSRPPLPPRVHQGTPPLKFTADRMSLSSCSVDFSYFSLTNEQTTSVEMQSLTRTPPDSPLFEFQGEMVLNDLYDGRLDSSEQVTSCLVKASDLRNRPVPQLPGLYATHGVTLQCTGNSSLLKRRNLNLSHISSCEVPQNLLSDADKNKSTPISPYGETFLYHRPEDDQEILSNHHHHGMETSMRENNEPEIRNQLRAYHDAKLCNSNIEQIFSHSERCTPDNEPEMEYSTVHDSSCKLRSADQAVSKDCCNIQAAYKQSFMHREDRMLPFGVTGESTYDATDVEHESISPYACFYGVAKKTKEGWLDKLSPQGNCVFQKRWVKFDGENLSYYNNEKEMYSKGIIPLSSINTVHGLGDNKFEVVSSIRTFTFRVEKEGDRDDWIDTLLSALKSQSNILSQLNTRCAVTSDKFGHLELRGYKARIFVVLRGSNIWLYKSEQDFKGGIGITMVNTSVATVKDVDRKGFELSTPFRNFSFTAESEREKQEWIEAMQGLIAESLSDYEVAEKIWFNESNRNCADCRAPDPEWASINLGVVICKKCAGQHRSLGSNISKIRSLKLDTSVWSNELVELFIVVGNETANAFWAANLKAGEELDMDAPPNHRLEFITQKYKEGKFRKKLSFLNQEELNKALCQAVVKQGILETMSLVFSGADVMCATGEATHCTPYLLAQKAGQRLQMEFLFHNKLSVLPKIDALSKAGFDSNNSQSSFLCGFLYKAINTTRTVTEKRLKEEFHKRWCTLEGGFLSYYENDKSATPNGRIDISEVVCLGVAKSDLTWGPGVSSTFEVFLLSERVFSFGTDNVEILKDWTRAISKFFVPAVVEILSRRDYELIGRLFYKDVHDLEHWKAGWFALEKSQLYFCPEQDMAEEDSVHLKRLQELTVSTEIEKHSEKRDVLLLVEKGRTLYIHGHTKLDFTVWHTAIRKAAGTDGNALRDQQLSKNDIPIIVDSCIAFVTQYGLGCEGIYQKNGTPSRVNLLLDQFRKDARNVKLRIGEHQLGDVADVMKRFLFEIDDALLTKELYPYWLSALDVQNEKERLEKYRMLIQTLPRVNRVTLAALIGHLYRVQKCSKMNQMNTHSLSQVFSPYLFQTEGQTKQEVNVTEDLINLYVQLFDVNEDQVKQMEIENSFITTWKDTQVVQAEDLLIEVYVGNKEPDCCCIIRVSPTMTAEELTQIVLEMKSVVADEKVVWAPFEVIENGELERLLHYRENVLEQVLQWSTLPEPESAYLIIKQFSAANAIKKYLAENIKDLGKAGILKWREEPCKLLSGNKFQERYFVLRDEKLLLYKDVKSNKTEREVPVKSLKLYLGLKKKLKPPSSFGFTLYSEKQQWFLCCDKEDAHVEWLASLLNAQHEGDLWRLDGKLHISSTILNAKLGSMGLTPVQKKTDGRKVEQAQKDSRKLKLNDVLHQTLCGDTQGRSHQLAACLQHSEVLSADGQDPNRPTLRPGQTRATQSNTKLRRCQGSQYPGQGEGTLNKMVFGTDTKLHSQLMQELNNVFLKSSPPVKNE